LQEKLLTREIINTVAIPADIAGSTIAVNNTRSAVAIARIFSILAFTTFFMNPVGDANIALSLLNAEERKRLLYSVPMNISTKMKPCL